MLLISESMPYLLSGNGAEWYASHTQTPFTVSHSAPLPRSQPDTPHTLAHTSAHTLASVCAPADAPAGCRTCYHGSERSRQVGPIAGAHGRDDGRGPPLWRPAAASPAGGRPDARGAGRAGGLERAGHQRP